MRTDDNLSRHESYFFAELRRLKAIKEKLTGNKKAFIILDEILRGTNSEDKLKGSWKYMEQLIEKSGIGIVATHDLKLTELIEKHPDKIENLCFEIELSDKGLFFDYKLFKGVTKTMNATFLMKQMEII
jgi:DNA mismatch repair ATPase MutS